MSNDRDIKTLNSLIATTLDSADGYAEAAGYAEVSSLGALFRARAAERRAAVTAMQARVTALGGEPKDGGTVLASAHRMFINLRAGVAKAEDKTLVDEIERGEDYLRRKFDQSLQDHELAPDTLAVITQAYGSVRSGHDQMRGLRDAMNAG